MPLVEAISSKNTVKILYFQLIRFEILVDSNLEVSGVELLALHYPYNLYYDLLGSTYSSTGIGLLSYCP
jgi:hypothetical protein